MNTFKKLQQKEITSAAGGTSLADLRSLMRANFKFCGKHQDMVINIRLNQEVVADFLRMIFGKPFGVHFFLSQFGVACCYKESIVNSTKSDENINIIDFIMLTPRELEVLDKLNDNLRNKEIAVALGMSTDTVKTHLKNIYPKLGVKNRREAFIKYNKIITGKLQLPLKNNY